MKEKYLFVPPRPKFTNRIIDKKELKRLMAWAFSNYGTGRASYMADRLKELGFSYATKAGISETGLWETKLVNGVREFKISFSSELLHQLEVDWKSFEFNNSLVHLRNVDNSNNTKYLYFEKKKY